MENDGNIINKIVNISPSLRQQYFLKAEKFLKTGEIDKSVIYYRKCLLNLENEPNFPHITKCLRSLSNYYTTKGKVTKSLKFVEAEKLYYQNLLNETKRFEKKLTESDDLTNTDVEYDSMNVLNEDKNIDVGNKIPVNAVSDDSKKTKNNFQSGTIFNKSYYNNHETRMPESQPTSNYHESIKKKPTPPIFNNNIFLEQSQSSLINESKASGSIKNTNCNIPLFQHNTCYKCNILFMATCVLFLIFWVLSIIACQMYHLSFYSIFKIRNSVPVEYKFSDYLLNPFLYFMPGKRSVLDIINSKIMTRIK